MKRIISLILILCLCFSVIGCQSKEATNDSQMSSGKNEGEKEIVKDHYPVIITNYDTTGEKVEQVFKKPPERVVCMETQIAQVMLALGLEEKIVGVAKSVGNVSDKYLDTFNSLELLADDGYPSKEIVINADPDMIIGWGSAFSEKNLGSVNDWIDKGIHTYAMENTVASKVTGPRTVERIYIDIKNLGMIFNVEDRAEELIADMKARAKVIDEATSALDDTNRVKVLTIQMVYENEFFGRSDKDLTTDLIRIAGGISLDREFGKQSMENIIDLNPDVMLIIDRTDSRAEDKIAALKSNSALKNVRAIKNNRFVPVKYVDFYGGAYETIEIIERMAKSFYPKELKDLDTSQVKSNVTNYPITITNYDGYIESNKGAVVEQVFKKRPKRIYAVSQAVTELLISLGLTDDIIATSHAHSPVYAPLADQYNSIEFVGEGSYPSKEVFVSYSPDIIVGWGSLFSDKTMGSVLDWHEKDVNTYVMQNTVANLGDRNVYWILNDIENLGKIFDVQERARELKTDIENRISAIEDKIKNIKEEDKPTVHTVQYMYENEYLPRASIDLTSDIIRLAGGKSIDDKSGKQSIENLIEKNPDIILAVNLKKSPAEETIKTIKEHPSLKNLNAVKNNKFLIIEHTAFYCGSLQTIESIEALHSLISE